MLASIQEPMYADLKESGLIPSDLSARWIDNAERGMTNTPFSIQGYVIPYNTLYGKMMGFYRVRLFDSDPKYRQPKDSANHVYFPKNFEETAKNSKFVIITEGEKKAALATKLGFPAVAFGGVDSWRTRSVILPADTELSAMKEKIKAKLPAQSEPVEDFSSNLAVGMQDLIDYLVETKKHVIVVYDSDRNVGTSSQIQRAAATLGFELRFRGVDFSHIRQIILPPVTEKTGLDDYLTREGPDKFRELVETCLNKRTAFPRHPNIRDYINKKLQKAMMSRREVQALSIAILSDLDANGIRLQNQNHAEAYYFDFITRKLIKTTFDARAEDVSATAFGQFLYRRYGLSAADKKLILWLATQFTGELPIEEVTPHRIVARTNFADDSVHYQVSDSQYVTVSADGLELHDNGESGILFESGSVLPLDTEKLLQNFERMETSDTPVTNYWADVLSHVRLRDQGRQRDLTALLYYMSPYLHRWRGMQLPVEMVIGESGSGKSTLCELRLLIIEGEARLRNAPQDLKDWHASISNTGGLHVTDNVQLVDRNLRQKLSDELCRIITEPHPHIEMRRYYTNAELMRIPVNAVFTITAIQQPFQNADLLQRAVILDLDKSASLSADKPGIMYDAEWRNNQLEKFGNREGWVAHQLFVLHKFFKLVKEKWDSRYQAKHRLINFEQSLKLMAEVFGEDPTWIPNYLASSVDGLLSEADWTFEGIKVFCEEVGHLARDKKFSASAISEWAQAKEDYEKCEILVSPRRLGRYLQIHKSMVAQICGLHQAGTSNNKILYQIKPPQKVKA